MAKKPGNECLEAGKSPVLSGVVLALAACAQLLAACAQSSTTLPDTASMPTRASADADRARHSKAMGETSSAATARQTKAIEQIESSR